MFDHASFNIILNTSLLFQRDLAVV